MKEKIVAVAGTNVMKIEGTREGLGLLEEMGWLVPRIVRSVTVPVNHHRVPPQPFGLLQTRKAAMFRACAALDADFFADYGVGIENGILSLDDGFQDGLDTPVVAIAHRLRPGHITYVLGMGIHVEGRFIRASEATGWQKTCGHFIAEEKGFKHDDWHEGYVGGAANRKEIIAAAVYLGFATIFKQ